jgi:hypothetical protein
MPALELINAKLTAKISQINLRKTSSSNQNWMTVK